MIAKEAAVKEFGVGEDLPFALWGWREDTLCVIGSLDMQYMREPAAERARRVAIASTVFRQGWGVDSFVFVAEAFVSTDRKVTEGKDLRSIFIQPNSPVMECLTFTRVESESYEVVTQPYMLQLGRNIVWHQILRSDESSLFRDTLYPKILQMALRLETFSLPPEPDAYFEILGKGLADDGFNVQWEFD